MTLLRAFLFVACGVALVQAHSAGAPDTACKSMLPDHPDSNKIPGGNAKYQLLAPARVGAGQQTTISLGGSPFKGFMVRALNAKGLSGNGHFAKGNNFQAISCDGNGDTATHASPTTPFNQVTLPWTAPTEPGVYRVMATIVEKYDTIYTGYFADVTVQ